MQSCITKARVTKQGILASSLKSDRATSEVTEQDLVVESGNTDHKVVGKNWFKSFREFDTTVTNPDGCYTKVTGIGEVEVLAEHFKGCAKILALKTFYVPGYRTNLISVTSVIEMDIKWSTKKKQFSSPGKQKWTSYKKIKKHFFLRTPLKQEIHFAILNRGQMKLLANG